MPTHVSHVAISMLKCVKPSHVYHVNCEHSFSFINIGIVFAGLEGDPMRGPNVDSITRSLTTIAHGWNSKSLGTLECAPSS